MSALAVSFQRVKDEVKPFPAWNKVEPFGMGNVPAAVAEAKRSVAGATAAIAATKRPSPVSSIFVLAGTARVFLTCPQ